MPVVYENTEVARRVLLEHGRIAGVERAMLIRSSTH